METRSRKRQDEIGEESDPFHSAGETEDGTTPNPCRGPATANAEVPPLRSSTPMTSATFSEESVAALISAMQKSHTETLQTLVNSMMRSSPASDVATMANCKATFSGSSSESVSAFIDGIEVYAECCHVPESSILKGLSMLLSHNAATWWLGIKTEMKTWEEVKENLLSSFGDRRPPHKVYLDRYI